VGINDEKRVWVKIKMITIPNLIDLAWPVEFSCKGGGGSQTGEWQKIIKMATLFLPKQ
jgi:hypothetical protein